jgi:uncharacterized membrane protein
MRQWGRAGTSEPAPSEIASDIAMDNLVGYILLVGVLLSAALMVAGLAWHWGRTGELGLEFTIAGMNFFEFVLDDLRQVVAGAARPRLLVSLGIAVLMLTPYARVAVSILYFAFAERNWKYTLFTSLVFSVLTYSLFLR